jgi:hypothetical protein
MKRLTAITYHFLLEFTFGLLLVFFIYIESKEIPPITHLFGLCFGGFISLILLVEKFAGKGKWIYLFIALPILLVVGTKLHFSIYIVALICLLVFWRGLSLYSDYTGHSDTLFLFLSFLFGILLIIYSAMLHYPYQQLILFLIIFQILLVLLGIFISKWSNVSDGKMSFFVYFLKVLGAAAILGAGITFILKYVQYIFFGILNALAFIFSFLTVPSMKVWEFIISLFLSRVERKPQNLDSDMKKAANDHGHTTMTLNYVYLIIVAACIGLLIYYIKKKRVHLLVTSDYLSSVEMNTAGLRQERGLFFKNRVKPPEDPIRREIFYLEKYAYKLKLGRYPYETLDEWWNRMGLIETEAINQTYDKVRYGLIGSSIEEQHHVKKVITDLKQKIKELAKMRKQAEK